MVRALGLRQNLQDCEVPALAQLLFMLEKVYLMFDREDERLWLPDNKVRFSVKSFYNLLNGG